MGFKPVLDLPKIRYLEAGIKYRKEFSGWTPNDLITPNQTFLTKKTLEL